MSGEIQGDIDTLDALSFTDQEAIELQEKELFLNGIERWGEIKYVERKFGLQGKLKKWIEEDSAFSNKVEDSQLVFKSTIFAEVARRGMHGVVRKKFYKGGPIIDPETGKQYVEREYSDRLLLSLAAAHDERFRQSSKVEIDGNMEVEHSGSISVGMTVQNALYNDPEYLEYVETKRLEGGCDPVIVGQVAPQESLPNPEPHSAVESGGPVDAAG